MLDPFLGSGTTAVACLLEGRRCTGIERDPHYCAVARRRVRDALRELERATDEHNNPAPEALPRKRRAA